MPNLKNLSLVSIDPQIKLSDVFPERLNYLKEVILVNMKIDDTLNQHLSGSKLEKIFSPM